MRWIVELACAIGAASVLSKVSGVAAAYFGADVSFWQGWGGGVGLTFVIFGDHAFGRWVREESK